MGPHHKHDQMMKAQEKQLPVIVLTGYLGAGKTTLLNYVLSEQRDKKLAVIENEIGEVSVDDMLVEQSHKETTEELIVLDNGCICCTIRGDLQKTLMDLAQRWQKGKVKLDGVLIELTGAADPAPVVQTFFMDDEIAKSFYIDNVVALIDAKHCIEKLDESKGDPDERGTACAQIAFSSVALLNKVDLVDAPRLVECEKRIKQLNGTITIIQCEQARVPLDKLFDVRAFNLSTVLDEQYMDEDEFHSFYKPKMDRSISNVGVKFHGALNFSKLKGFLDTLIGSEETAVDFMRIKGVLNIGGDDRMFVLQCVHMLRNQNFTEPWGSPPETRESRIIFIGRGMHQRRQELTDGVMACIMKPFRFAIGDKILARTGEKHYSPGNIVAYWYGTSPYQIKLDKPLEPGSDGLIHAPMDEDVFVMACGSSKAVELLAEATQYKEKGNDLFKAGNYTEALVQYHQALTFTTKITSLDGKHVTVEQAQMMVPSEKSDELKKLKSSVYSNRAMCHAKSEPPEFSKAIANLNASIALEPSVKSYVKRGQAFLGTGNLSAAREDFDKATKLDKNKSCSKMIGAEMNKLKRLRLQQKQEEKKRYEGLFPNPSAEGDGVAAKKGAN